MSCYTHNMAIVSWPQTLWRHFTLCIGHNSQEQQEKERWLFIETILLRGAVEMLFVSTADCVDPVGWLDELFISQRGTVART